jgi:Flp pilus assembly protein TadB
MPLLPREQHALNQIEERLSGDDPALASYLAGRLRVRHPRRLAAGLFTLSPALLVAGLIAGAMPLVYLGVVSAPLTPVAVWLVATHRRRRRHPGHG